jgi:hypothetical protein
MRHHTKSLLDAARNEKDVENAYRGEIGHHRPEVGITSPFGSDGYAQWKDVRALLEFKYDLALKQHRDQCGVLGQMILYLKKFEQAGQIMPNVLFVGDKNECFALEVGAVKHFLALPIDWSAPPSAGSPDLTRALLDGLAISPFVFDVGCDFRDVLDKIEVLAKGEVHRVKATAANIGAMFTFWEDNVFLPTSGLTSTEQVDVFLRCLFKPDDVVAHGANKNILVVEGRKIPINGHQWQSFINHFVRGYKPSEIEGFYASKDRLVEDDSRRRQGAFFTPTLWVAEAHKMIETELGADWREKCIVWDPACGTGNLTRDYDFGSLILSTLEQSDVDVIREQGYNPGANLFRYDFLNDDSSPFFDGKNTMPDSVDEMLREAAKAGKRLVFLMNPPYGTANNAGTEEGDHKAGIALTAVNTQMKAAKIGASSQQLYAQFMYRSAKLAEVYGFKQVTVATYSVPTFMCSGSYKGFRDFWYSRLSYRSGMLFQASHFADVSGRWGVSFTLWSEGVTDSRVDLPIELKDVKNFGVIRTGIKPFYNSDGREASKWVREPLKGLKGVDAPQMSSGLRVKEGSGCRGTLVPGALGYMTSVGNNITKSDTDVFLTSSCSSMAHGFSVLPGESFRRTTALMAARLLVPESWERWTDEYLAPDTTLPGYEQWNEDCIIWALLYSRRNNCTAMRDVSYKGRAWRIKNNFWWKTRAESRVLYDHAACGQITADLRAETTDSYLASILPTLNLSPEAQACLTQLDALLVSTLPHRESFATARPELHLMAHDSGIYQLKHLFKEYEPEAWKALQVSFKALADRLRPGVYDFEFLRA